MRRGWAQAGGLVVLAVLAGCSGGDGPDPTPTGSRWLVGPLQALVRGESAIDPDSPSAVDDWLAILAAREDATAACMAEQGFEYWPVLPDPANVDNGAGPIDRRSREFAEQYGFGIDHMPESVGGELHASYTGEEPGQRENDEYFLSLSDEAQAAYLDAMAGPATESTVEPDGGISTSRSGPGCQWNDGDAEFPVVREAQEYLDALPEDGAFDEVNRAWSRCLRESGFEAESPAALEAALAEERWGGGPPVGHARSSFAEREVAAAVASWDCRATLGYDERTFEIRSALEQAWVDEHRAELDAWLERRGG